MTPLPKISIKYNKFLDPIFIGYIQAQPQWKDWTPPPIDEVMHRVEEYQHEWNRYGDRILSALCDITNLQFQREVIDVHIVSGNPRQFSHPIVIKATFEPGEFIDVLTHELIHRLFTINLIKKSLIYPPESLSETETTKNHIVLHALLKHIYLNVLEDSEKLFNNIERSKRHSTTDYIRAWDIVNEIGYKNIIEAFKERLLKKNPQN